MTDSTPAEALKAKDLRCVKCGKRRSAHNWFTGFGYLCHNGSNTFLAETPAALSPPDAGEGRTYRDGVREQVARDIWAAEYDEDLPAEGTIQHAMAMQMADAAIAAIRKLP